MSTRQGRRTAAILSAVGVTLVAALAFAYRDRIAESWHLSRLDAESEAREHAARRLGEMRSARAVPRLVEMLKDDVGLRPGGQIAGTHQIPRREGHFTLERLRSEVWRTYWPGQVLAEIGLAAAPDLAGLLTDEDPFVRLVAVETLSSIGSAALPSLEEFFEQTGVPTAAKIHALYAIEEMAPAASAKAVPFLVACASTPGTTSALVSRDEADEIREHAVFVLGEIGETGADASRAIPALEALANDVTASPNLRHAAGYALLKIRP